MFLRTYLDTSISVDYDILFLIVLYIVAGGEKNDILHVTR